MFGYNLCHKTSGVVFMPRELMPLYFEASSAFWGSPEPVLFLGPSRKTLWENFYLKVPEDLGFPGSSDGKESACNAGDPGSILGVGRSPGEENGNPL